MASSNSLSSGFRADRSSAVESKAKEDKPQGPEMTAGFLQVSGLNI